MLGMALSLCCGSAAFGDSPAPTPKERTMKGASTAVDRDDKMILVKGFWGQRRFNLANDCQVRLNDSVDGSVSDLRPGQKLDIRYENAHGVLVAHRITQHDLRITGSVKLIDHDKRTMIVRAHGLDKFFAIADDCSIKLHGDRTGTLSDVQPGHHITVTYEVPGGAATARIIAQTSETYTGTLTAVDLENRTVKAKGLLRSKMFNLADNCKIVLNGEPDASLRDLKPGDKLVFSYDDVNGVNVANRVAVTDRTGEAPAVASDQSNPARD
jgi:hypothetical protein